MVESDPPAANNSPVESLQISQMPSESLGRWDVCSSKHFSVVKSHHRMEQSCPQEINEFLATLMLVTAFLCASQRWTGLA